MDDIYIPISVVVALSFPPVGRSSRDGPIRHPSNGWPHKNTNERSSQNILGLTYAASPDQPSDGVITPGGLRLLRQLQRQASGEAAVELPPNQSQLRHIFADRAGHLADTPINRQLFIDLANDPLPKLGADKFGNIWSAKVLPDGSQLWVQVRGGRVINGGLNLEFRAFNPETGLSALKPANE